MNVRNEQASHTQQISKINRICIRWNMYIGCRLVNNDKKCNPSPNVENWKMYLCIEIIRRLNKRSSNSRSRARKNHWKSVMMWNCVVRRHGKHGCHSFDSNWTKNLQSKFNKYNIFFRYALAFRHLLHIIHIFINRGDVTAIS